jgi:hypothetical protein
MEDREDGQSTATVKADAIYELEAIKAELTKAGATNFTSTPSR